MHTSCVSPAVATATSLWQACGTEHRAPRATCAAAAAAQVTLLLCNAIAMEALPIFLDKLMQEWVAILVSVTAVLFAGEIFPQAICSK